MGNSINVIESSFDNLKFERAFLAADKPRAMISGILCNLDTKPSLLECGLAFCQPVDPVEAENWPVYTDVELNGVADRWWNITNDPATVQAARELALQIAQL